MKNLLLIISALLISVTSFAIAPIQSDTVICSGIITQFTDTTAGGKWYSSDTSIGVIDSLSGMFTGVAAGAATITYITDSGYATKDVKVIQGAGKIMGMADICVGNTVMLSDTVAGGKWRSDDIYNNLVKLDTLTGTVMAVGSYISVTHVHITYTTPNGCHDTMTVTTHVLGGGFQVNAFSVCLHRLSDIPHSEQGGYWTMYDTTIATIDTATGSIFAKAIGDDTAIYTVTNVCGTATDKIAVHIYDTYDRPCWVSAPETKLNNGGLSIYPNPAESILTVTTDALYPINNVAVTSLDGHSCITQYTDAQQKLQVDVAKLIPGIYFIRINGEYVQRFLKK